MRKATIPAGTIIERESDGAIFRLKVDLEVDARIDPKNIEITYFRHNRRLYSVHTANVRFT
jgi:hypothetical protein